jgi:hypothetical protein
MVISALIWSPSINSEVPRLLFFFRCLPFICAVRKSVTCAVDISSLMRFIALYFVQQMFVAKVRIR